MSTRVLRNALFVLSGQAVLFVLWFAVVRGVFRGMGGEILGILYFSVLVASIAASVGEVGISSTVVREVSGNLATDPSRVRGLLRTFSLLYWAAFALLAAVMIAASPFVVRHWLQPRELSTTAAARVLAIVSVGALLALPRSLYTSVFRGLQRMELSSGIEVASALVQQVGALAVLRAGAGTETLFTWWAGAGLTGVVLGWLLARGHLPSGALRPGWSPEALVGIRRYTWGTLKLSLLSLVHTHLDKVVVARLLPLEVFGLYGVVFGAVVKGSLPAAATGQAAFPAFAGEAPLERGAHLWRLQELVSFGLAPVFAGIVFAALPVLGYVFDPSVARGLLVPTALLAVSFYMNGVLQPLSALALAAGRPDIGVRFNLYALLVGLPATIVFVRAFGLVGAALGWVLYHVIAYAYGVPRTVRECLLESPRRWFTHAVGTLLLALSVYAPAYWLAGVAGGAPALAAGYAAGTLAFAVGASRLASPSTREYTRLGLGRLRAWLFRPAQA